MEHELRLHLIRCAETYSSLAVHKRGLATLGRLAANDWRFFERLREEKVTFTARKYDEVIGWFSANWPDDCPWPDDVPRPPKAVADSAATGPELAA